MTTTQHLMIKCRNKLERMRKPSATKLLLLLLALMFAFLVGILPLLPGSGYVNAEMSLSKYEELDSPGFLKLDSWIPGAVGISSGKADIRIPSNYELRFRLLYYFKFHSFEGLRIKNRNKQ